MSKVFVAAILFVYRTQNVGYNNKANVHYYARKPASLRPGRVMVFSTLWLLVGLIFENICTYSENLMSGFAIFDTCLSSFIWAKLDSDKIMDTGCNIYI